MGAGQRPLPPFVASPTAAALVAAPWRLVASPSFSQTVGRDRRPDGAGVGAGPRRRGALPRRDRGAVPRPRSSCATSRLRRQGEGRAPGAPCGHRGVILSEGRSRSPTIPNPGRWRGACASLGNRGAALVEGRRASLRPAGSPSLRDAEGDPGPRLRTRHSHGDDRTWLAPNARRQAALLSQIDASDVLVSWPALDLPYDPRAASRRAGAHPFGAAADGLVVAVDYEGDEPAIAIRVQELYGLETHPALAGGRRPLVLELALPGAIARSR